MQFGRCVLYLRRSLTSHAVRHLTRISTLYVLRVYASANGYSLRVDGRQSHRGTPILSFRRVHRSRSLPILIRRVLATSHVSQSSASQLSQFRCRVRFYVVARQLGVPCSFGYVFGHFFMGGVPASGEGVRIGPFFCGALRGLHLRFTRRLSLGLSYLFVPSCARRQVFFLRLSRVLRRPISVATFQRLRPMVRGQLRCQYQEALLRPGPLSQVDPNGSYRDASATFFYFLRRLMLIPKVGPSLISFLLREFFLYRVFRSLFSLRCSIYSLRVYRTTTL